MQIARLSHLTRRKIAEELGISEATVKTHFNSILRKMKVGSKEGD